MFLKSCSCVHLPENQYNFLQDLCVNISLGLSLKQPPYVYMQGHEKNLGSVQSSITSDLLVTWDGDETEYIPGHIWQKYLGGNSAHREIFLKSSVAIKCRAWHTDVLALQTAPTGGPPVLFCCLAKEAASILWDTIKYQQTKASPESRRVIWWQK